MIDSHAHILEEYYSDAFMMVQDVFREARRRGVVNIIECGDSIETSKEVSKYASEFYNLVYAAVGIHPQNDDEFNEKNMIILENLIKRKGVVAIGEIGLDYHFSNTDKERQIQLFRRQLSLAEKYNLPVIVHSRDAIQDTYEILKEYQVKGVIHCFSGSLEMAKLFIRLGFYLGIGGAVTFKNSLNLVDVVKNIRLECLLLETDSPFMSPVPLRGSKNVPWNISYVAEKIAEIKGMYSIDVVKTTTNNAVTLFDLKY